MTRTVATHLDPLSAGQSRPDDFVDVVRNVGRPYRNLSHRDSTYAWVCKIIKESLDRAGFRYDICIDLYYDLVSRLEGVLDGVLQRSGFSLSLTMRQRGCLVSSEEVCCSVGAAVINNKHVAALKGLEESRQRFRLVIGAYDDKRLP